MELLCKESDIQPSEWESLVSVSSTASWFQTREAFEFFNGLPLMKAFVVAVKEGEILKGLVTGYIQKDGGKLKQFFSKRAIILGGPLLADSITDDELSSMLHALKDRLKREAIFIETRNFNDFSKWRKTFEDCGFRYEPHLNFHLNTESEELAQSNIGKHRWRYIRISMRDGAKLVDHPSWEQIKSFYEMLDELYRTKVKKPLYPLAFFEKLYGMKSAKFFLVEYESVIIGGSLCMCLEGKTVYEWAKCGNDHYRKNIYPSSVATWLGIQYAANNGFLRYDFLEDSQFFSFFPKFNIISEKFFINSFAELGYKFSFASKFVVNVIKRL